MWHTWVPVHAWSLKVLQQWKRTEHEQQVPQGVMNRAECLWVSPFAISREQKHTCWSPKLKSSEENFCWQCGSGESLLLRNNLICLVKNFLPPPPLRHKEGWEEPSLTTGTLPVCISQIQKSPLNKDLIFLIKATSKKLPWIRRREDLESETRPVFSVWFIFWAGCFSLKHHHMLSFSLPFNCLLHSKIRSRISRPGQFCNINFNFGLEIETKHLFFWLVLLLKRRNWIEWALRSQRTTGSWLPTSC